MSGVDYVQPWPTSVAEYIAGLSKELEKAEGENERLRDKNMLLAVDKRGIKACYDNLSEQYKELEAENAKLRLMVRDLERARSLLCDEYPNRLCVDCEKCPANVVCDTDPVKSMRELGIEVGQ